MYVNDVVCAYHTLLVAIPYFDYVWSDDWRIFVLERWSLVLELPIRLWGTDILVYNGMIGHGM